jgi:hypothetical protein
LLSWSETWKYTISISRPPDSRSGLILITNGMLITPTKYSSYVFYDFEEAIFSAARKNINIDQ